MADRYLKLGSCYSKLGAKLHKLRSLHAWLHSIPSSIKGRRCNAPFGARLLRH